LGSAEVDRCEFVGAVLDGADMKELRALNGTSFEGASCVGASLKSASLQVCGVWCVVRVVSVSVSLCL
jgi:uncharacterized protein YjbI with pentapeptide repeats